MAWTGVGNEVSRRRAEAVVDRGDINNVRRGPVVGPPTAVADGRGPAGRRCRLALTSGRLSASPDARIIDVSSSRTSTVPDVLLNARRRAAPHHPSASRSADTRPPMPCGPAAAEEEGKTSFR